MQTHLLPTISMKKLFALLGSFTLLAACTFTVTTEMNDGEEADAVPVEEGTEAEGTEESEAVEEGTEEIEEIEEIDDQPLPSADAEEEAEEELMVEDAGGDGSDTAEADPTAE